MGLIEEENFTQRLIYHLNLHPEQTAIILQQAGQTDLPLTYRALISGAANCRRKLQANGVNPGDVVILIAQHGPALVFGYFGAILSGAIPSILPYQTEKLQPEKYRSDIKRLLHVTRPAAVITSREQSSDVRALLPGYKAPPLIVLLEEPHNEDFVREDMSGIERDAEEIALLQHSSGTTGLQKGVALSFRSIINQINSYGRAIHLSTEDVVVSWLPLYHDMGLIAGFLMPVLFGVPLVLMSPFDWIKAPQKLLQSISKYRGTLCWMPNFAFNFCAGKIRDRHLAGVNLSSLRMLINCSEPVKNESHQLFVEKFAPFGLKPETLAVSYAMAENVFAVSQTAPGAAPRVEWIDREMLQKQLRAEPVKNNQPYTEVVSCGHPIEGTEMRIANSATPILPEKSIGEIHIRSNCMLTEYYNRPEETQKSLHDGWFSTGDYGYLSGGELFVTGRKKDVIIVGGKNIYPQDLEYLAMQVRGVHPGRVVVFGVFDPVAGTEEVVLVAEIDEAETASEGLIAEDIRKAVTTASDVVLRKVALVRPHWLIKTSSGKIARAANRDKYIKEFGQHQYIR
jgi:acyl-CoA synthetase (AMP-forming)/AMP-acid ligase II